jgi:TPR repeat protein
MMLRALALLPLLMAACSAPPAPPPAAPPPPAEPPAPVSSAKAVVEKPREESVAERLHRLACTGDVGDYAARAAQYRAKWTRPKRDPAVVFAEDKARCDSGEACGRLAEDYASGTGVARDQARASALYRKDCEEQRGFFWPVCAELADRYAAGLGLRRDARRAVALYERVCPEGMYGACLPLADMIRAGQGAPRDEAHAHQVESRAAGGFANCCAENGDSACCQRAAQMVREGRSHASDEARARMLELSAALRADAACRAGNAAECHDLAQRHVLGRGVEGDMVCADRLFDQACAGGYQPACAPVRFSDPPADADFAFASEVTVKHSSALGCETKVARGWLRVRCAAKGAIEAPVDGRFTRGVRDLEASAVRGGGVVTLLTAVRAGDDIEARVVWPRTGIRTLHVRWPKGAAAAVMDFDRGK